MNDEPRRQPFAPGKPMCRNCGTEAPPGDPGPNDRCALCHLHLRHCRNCMLVNGYECLLRLPYRWPSAGLPGQDCPEFLWRDDVVAGTLQPSDFAPGR